MRLCAFSNKFLNDPEESREMVQDVFDDNITIAINKIPPKCKRIFDLSRVEWLKYGEIAELLNISVKTVEAQMSKALNILRLELKDYLILLILGFIFIENYYPITYQLFA